MEASISGSTASEENVRRRLSLAAVAFTDDGN